MKLSEASPEKREREGPPGRFVTLPARPMPSVGELRGSLSALARLARRPVRPDDLDSRDPGFIREMIPLMDLLYDHYFRCETELEADFPKGPFLAVANHNGMTGTPDMFCHMAAFWRHAGIDRPSYGLMHDMPFQVPAAGTWLNAAGAIRASTDNARAALARGAGVLVFPGGDVDACKPYASRYEIRFGERRGFIRTAIREQVPIVPVVSVGAHESLFLFTDGQRIARRLGLKKYFRSNVAPIGLALPWGIVLGIPYPHLPPPVKVHTRILRPIDLEVPRSAANDPQVVEAGFQRVVLKMKVAMEALAKDGRHGLFPRPVPHDGRRATRRAASAGDHGHAEPRRAVRHRCAGGARPVHRGQLAHARAELHVRDREADGPRRARRGEPPHPEGRADQGDRRRTGLARSTPRRAPRHARLPAHRTRRAPAGSGEPQPRRAPLRPHQRRPSARRLRRAPECAEELGDDPRRPGRQARLAGGRPGPRCRPRRARLHRSSRPAEGQPRQGQRGPRRRPPRERQEARPHPARRRPRRQHRQGRRPRGRSPGRVARDAHRGHRPRRQDQERQGEQHQRRHRRRLGRGRRQREGLARRAVSQVCQRLRQGRDRRDQRAVEKTDALGRTPGSPVTLGQQKGGGLGGGFDLGDIGAKPVRVVYSSVVSVTPVK